MAATSRCFVPFRQPLLFQPVETVTPFSFSRVIDEARSIWFPEVDDDVETRFATLGPLASIWPHRMGREHHVVVFHPILNRADVPYEVVRLEYGCGMRGASVSRSRLPRTHLTSRSTTRHGALFVRAAAPSFASTRSGRAARHRFGGNLTPQG